MKKAILIIFSLYLLSACTKPVQPNSTDTSYPFEISRIDAAFLERIDTLDIIGDREISSVESDADWISTMAQENGSLRLEIKQNETAEHRTDTLHVNFDDGGSFDLVVSQNAYPMIYVTCTKDPAEIATEIFEYGKADIPLEIELGEDVTDFGLAFATANTLLNDKSTLCEILAGDNDSVIHLDDPHLWQVRNAYLYTLKIELSDSGKVIDSYSLEIGIRDVRISGKDILINGVPVYLKGFGKHEDSDIVGRGFNIGVMKRDFELMKWIGANSFRTSHYPYDEEIYRMADREGFLIIDEVPGVGLFESLVNFLDAGTGKGAKSFFSKPTTPILLKAHLRAVEEMIARDKNHPSVIAWSLLNEPESTDENSVPYFEKLFAAAHDLDIQHRPRTFAMESNSSPTRCICHHFSDFICLNRYYGWYILGGYEIVDAEKRFRAEMDEWKALDLNKPFVFTEYGADTLPSEHKLPSVMWSQEYQNEVLELQHRVFDSYDFIRGEQVWNFADFQTTEGLMRVNGNKKGIFTRQRQPKDVAFLLKKRWESLPLDYKA